MAKSIKKNYLFIYLLKSKDGEITGRQKKQGISMFFLTCKKIQICVILSCYKSSLGLAIGKTNRHTLDNSNVHITEVITSYDCGHGIPIKA